MIRILSSASIFLALVATLLVASSASAASAQGGETVPRSPVTFTVYTDFV